MILQILSVQDIKAGAFHRPFFAQSEQAGARSFIDEVNRSSPDNIMNTHPEDFILFKLGSWDDETGEFSVHSPQVVVAATTVLK